MFAAISKHDGILTTDRNEFTQQFSSPDHREQGFFDKLASTQGIRSNPQAFVYKVLSNSHCRRQGIT
jgi:hypothetical protein